MPDPSSDAQELRALEEKRRTSGLDPAEEARRSALQGAAPPAPVASKGFDIRAAVAGVRALIADDAGAPRRPPPPAPQVREAAERHAPPPASRPDLEARAPAPEPPPEEVAAAPQNEASPASVQSEPDAAVLPSSRDVAQEQPAEVVAPSAAAEPVDEEPELIEELEPIEEEPEPAFAASGPVAPADAPPAVTAPPPPAPDWMAPPPSPGEVPAPDAYLGSLELLEPVDEPRFPAAPRAALPDAPPPAAAPPDAEPAALEPLEPVESSEPVGSPASPPDELVELEEVAELAPVEVSEPEPPAPPIALQPAEARDAGPDAAPAPATDAPPSPAARYTAADYGLDPADPASVAWAAWYASQGWDPETAYAWAERQQQSAAAEGSAPPAEGPAPSVDMRFEAAGAPAAPPGEPEPTVEIATFEPGAVDAPTEPGADDASGFMVPAPAAPARVPVPAEEEIAIEADFDAPSAVAPAEEEVASDEVTEEMALSEDQLAASLGESGAGPASSPGSVDDAFLPDEAFGVPGLAPHEEAPAEELPLDEVVAASIAAPPLPTPVPDPSRFELADSGTFTHARLGLAGSADPLPDPLDEVAPLEGLEWVQTSALPGDELPVDLSTFEQPPVRGDDPSEHATVVWSLGQSGHTPVPTAPRAPPRETAEPLEVIEDDILELPEADVPALAPAADASDTEAFSVVTPPPAPLTAAVPEALDDRTLVMPLGERAAPAPEPLPAQAPAPVASAAAHVTGTHRVVVHTAEGQVRRGTITDASLDDEQLLLAPQGGGVPSAIPTGEIKAVFFMLPPGAAAPEATGQRVRVTFRDGRQVAGFSADYHPDKAGFFMIPADSRTHTERIWVYRAAVRQVVVS